jgi:hypothetical protein
MGPNYTHFIEADPSRRKEVCLRFNSIADSGVIDLVGAPLDYGPGTGIQDGVNRYLLWDYTSSTGSHTFSLLPEQVKDLRVLGELFHPAVFGVPPPQWSIPRHWGSALRNGSRSPARGLNTVPAAPGKSELLSPGLPGALPLAYPGVGRTVRSDCHNTFDCHPGKNQTDRARRAGRGFPP